MKRQVIVIGIVVAIGSGVAGCLGGEDRAAELQRGKQVFAEVGCGDCHTLADAGATGTIGPSLDAADPGYPDVVVQVTDGGPGMPAFGDRISEEEIGAVSRYVSEVAGGGSLAAVTAFEPDDTQLSQCRGAADQVCYEQAFANLVYEDGPGPALALLERQMETDGAVATGCHRIAHRMGSAALARFDDDVGQAFADGEAVCSSGYYHGILERSFSGVDEDELGEKAASLCVGGAVLDDPFLAFQCRHGLGHGLMIQTGYDLPLALDTCDALGSPDATTCQDGVFMENFTSSYGVTSEWLRDDDLIYPCNDVEDARKHSCYIIVTARILPEVDWNWRRAAQVCRAAEPAWEYACFRSFGRDAISTNAYDQGIARRLCGLTGDMEHECVLSVALHIANEEGGLRGASRFCRETPGPLRVYCYAGLGITASVLVPDPGRRTAACERLTADLRDRFACVSGTVAPV